MIERTVVHCGREHPRGRGDGCGALLARPEASVARSESVRPAKFARESNDLQVSRRTVLDVLLDDLSAERRLARDIADAGALTADLSKPEPRCKSELPNSKILFIGTQDLSSNEVTPSGVPIAIPVALPAKRTPDAPYGRRGENDLSVHAGCFIASSSEVLRLASSSTSFSMNRNAARPPWCTGVSSPRRVIRR